MRTDGNPSVSEILNGAAIIITYVNQSFRQIGRELIMGSTYTDAIQILEDIDDKKTFNFLLGYFNSMYHFMDENERENLIDDLVICTKDQVPYAGKVLRSIIDKCMSPSPGITGVFVDWFLYCDNAMRIAPPLIISKEEIEEACRVILEAIDKL